LTTEHSLLLNKFNVTAFQEDLLSWYNEIHRDLPWRKDQDPYKIWVSEIMLQQTRVDTVIPYFEKFMEKFPSIHDLANAEEETVLKAWEGLGYYSRARNLHSAVKEVSEKYGGEVPNEPKEIATLKGVGPYTAGAISSIAFGLPEPAVDGNVMRVLSRILLIKEDISKPKARSIFEQAVRRMISKENPSHFNQALMELGALVCTPRSPSCLLCPVQTHCHGFQEGIQDELPVKKKKSKVKTVLIAVAVLMNPKGEVLIHKRPSTGLLANLWQFPNHETVSKGTDQTEQLERYLQEQFAIKAQMEAHVVNFQHIFSHLKWNLAVYMGKTTANGLECEQDGRFVSLQELEQYPFPVSHQKIINMITTEQTP
jgi:A/G-specific adenine glycosylase